MKNIVQYVIALSVVAIAVCVVAVVGFVFYPRERTTMFGTPVSQTHKISEEDLHKHHGKAF